MSIDYKCLVRNSKRIFKQQKGQVKIDLDNITIILNGDTVVIPYRDVNKLIRKEITVRFLFFFKKIMQTLVLEYHDQSLSTSIHLIFKSKKKLFACNSRIKQIQNFWEFFNPWVLEKSDELQKLLQDFQNQIAQDFTHLQLSWGFESKDTHTYLSGKDIVLETLENFVLENIEKIDNWVISVLKEFEREKRNKLTKDFFSSADHLFDKTLKLENVQLKIKDSGFELNNYIEKIKTIHNSIIMKEKKMKYSLTQIKSVFSQIETAIVGYRAPLSILEQLSTLLDDIGKDLEDVCLLQEQHSLIIKNIQLGILSIVTNIEQGQWLDFKNRTQQLLKREKTVEVFGKLPSTQKKSRVLTEVENFVGDPFSKVVEPSPKITHLSHQEDSKTIIFEDSSPVIVSDKHPDDIWDNFCSNCGQLLRLHYFEDQPVSYCRNCDKTYKNLLSMSIKYRSKKNFKTIVFEEPYNLFIDATLPFNCPKCGHNRALIKSIRLTTDTEINIYQCTNCYFVKRELI